MWALGAGRVPIVVSVGLICHCSRAQLQQLQLACTTLPGMLVRLNPEARNVHANCVLAWYADGLAEDPRHVVLRVAH